MLGSGLTARVRVWTHQALQGQRAEPQANLGAGGTEGTTAWARQHAGDANTPTVPTGSPCPCDAQFTAPTTVLPPESTLGTLDVHM